MAMSVLSAWLIVPILFGIPLGMPPAAEDPVMARMAPADCLFFVTWAAAAAPDGSSMNETERLLAEPQVQRAIGRLLSQFDAVIDRMAADERDEAARVLARIASKAARWVLSETGAIAVSRVRPTPDEPDIQGWAVMRLGESGREMPALLLQLQKTAPPNAVTTVKVAGKTCYRWQFGPTAPAVAWGVFDGYWVMGFGEGQLAAAVEQMKGQAPEWYARASAAVPAARRATFAYFNIRGALDVAREFGPPQLEALIDGIGAANLKAIASSTGLDDHGIVSTTKLLIDGEPAGLFAPLAAAGLTRDELSAIPADAIVAAAVRLDLPTLVGRFVDTIGAVDARAASELRDGLREFEENLQLRLQEDVLSALGDTVYAYTAPSTGGLVSGWTLAVEVKDPRRLQRVHDTLLGFARGAAGGNRGEPVIRAIDSDDRTIHFLSAGREMPFAPAWCLTDSELIVGMFPQAVIAHLGRDRDAPLVDRGEVDALWRGGNDPVSLVYVDTAAIAQFGYPFLQVGAAVALPELNREGIDIDVGALPPLSAILPHLRPLVSMTRRSEDGIEFIQTQTLPGGNVGAAAPVVVALGLPAVQSARGASRRAQSTNHLKQIGLAMHNYHDTFRSLPPAYNTDKNGKPLLSWRVHVLPFIEQQALYEQFHFDEPWDSPHNRDLIARMPEVYRSPVSQAEPGKTTYLAIRGKQSILSPPKQGEDGKMPARGTSFADITDGTSNTLVVVEATDAAAVEWTRPDDLEVDMDEPKKTLVGAYPGVFLGLMMDGSVRALSELIDDGTVRALFTRNGGEAFELP
ncbi:MAG: DUF1559 domain-containing protein [Planctomycetes bacterium]|nr:DUF1559 domain-containing protein [Planctomycetota bacterium]